MVDHPTPEEFEAHMKVTRWYNEQRHQFELAEGRYTMHYSNDGATISTAHGEEPLTDEVFERLGWVRTETGWTNG